jgi:hypothetical protein
MSVVIQKNTGFKRPEGIFKKINWMTTLFFRTPRHDDVVVGL